MSLRYAFFINFESKMPSKKGPWEVSFLVCLISWFLKDVLNKILTFDSEMDPKIDAKRKNKSLKLEVEEKKAKMLQNGCQRDPEGYPNSKKIDTKTDLKRINFFSLKKRPIPCSNPKSCHFTPYICEFFKKTLISFEREPPTCRFVEARSMFFLRIYRCIMQKHCFCLIHLLILKKTCFSPRRNGR